MSAAIATLLGFVALTLGLAFAYVGYRATMGLLGKTPFNSWTRGAQTWEDPAIITRIHHAHLNCIENLPVYAAVLLAAIGLDQLAVMEGLACYYMMARVAQSSIHIVSTSAIAVFFRANALIVQWAILVYWVLALAGLI